MDIGNIKQFTEARPDIYTIFGTPEEFDKMPLEHRDQIHFLNYKASKYIRNLEDVSRIVTGDGSNPFNKDNFKETETFYIVDDGEKDLKKWLFNRGIQFRSEVFLLADQYVIVETWKIIVKYCFDIFFANDIILFDKTLNWCLYYFHHDIIYFGKNNVYNPIHDYNRLKAIDKLRKQFPNYKPPYL